MNRKKKRDLGKRKEEKAEKKSGTVAPWNVSIGRVRNNGVIKTILTVDFVERYRQDESPLERNN